MSKTFSLLLTIVFISACSHFQSSTKTGADSQSKLEHWADADIMNLEDTELNNRFQSDVQNVVYFKFNGSNLDRDSIAVLNRQINWLKQYPDALLVIEGHCDERGTREYNLALGEKRAISVKDYLILNGIDESRVRTISYGKERPEVLGADETAWAQNRRAKTIVN